VTHTNSAVAGAPSSVVNSTVTDSVKRSKSVTVAVVVTP
jgi:hypothetical protein